jgi:transposase InsO family protein
MSTIINEFSIRACCTALKLNRRGFKAWQNRLTQPESTLQADLKDCFAKHSSRAGAPKLVHDLRAKGHRISARTVSRRMVDFGLRARHPKKFKPTTDSKHDLYISPNLLERDFKAAKPNQKWVGDITYLRTKDGWLYLATVIDLYSRAIVGWQMSDRIDAKLITDALQAAYNMRGRPNGVVFHSDRGSQYCSGMFRGFLKQSGFVQSMSRKGNCWDNAVAESFFKSLKTEAVYGFALVDRDNMRAVVFEYIEVYYNTIRCHSTIGYVSPKMLEQRRAAVLKRRLHRVKLRQDLACVV